MFISLSALATKTVISKFVVPAFLLAAAAGLRSVGLRGDNGCLDVLLLKVVRSKLLSHVVLPSPLPRLRWCLLLLGLFLLLVNLLLDPSQSTGYAHLLSRRSVIVEM